METIEEYQANIDAMEQKIIDALGPEQARQDVNKYLGYDARKDMYEYIIRMHDLDYDPDREEAES